MYNNYKKKIYNTNITMTVKICHMNLSLKKKKKKNLKNDAMYAMLTHPEGHWMIRVIYRLTPEIIPASQPT